MSSCNAGSRVMKEFTFCGMKIRLWRSPKPWKLPPRCRLAHSFSNPLASQPPLFLPSSCSTYLSKHLTRWKLQSIALEQGILWKRWFACAFCKHFFSCSAIFTWIWDIDLLLAVFYRQSLSCEVIYESQGGLNFSNSDCFPLKPRKSPGCLTQAQLHV